MKFEQEDIQRFKMFKSVLQKADFDIKGEAIITVATLYKWFNELEPKIELAVKASLAEKSIANSKQKKEPINKIGD